ncbi:MAG: multiheme c-type cytochrome [Verrucomicrobiota bacterium]
MSFLRRPKLFWALTGYVGVFLLTSAIGSMSYFHFGNPERTCASCHEMGDMHSAWAKSFHRSFHCRDCHGGSLTLDTHALRSHVNRVVQHFSRTPTKAIGLKERDVLAVNTACQECHPESFADWQRSRHSATYARIFLDPKHNRTELLSPDCLRCHGMFFDGHIEDLVTPISTTGPWAFKDPAKAAQPTIPCLACHQVHKSSDGFKSPQLYVRREHTHFSSSLLPVTPIVQGERVVKLSTDSRQRLCTQCHAPNAFRQLGTGDDRTPAGVHEGLSCRDCHSSHSQSAKASCANCHPANSHCGLNVEKMDTSFLSIQSKHNIHVVACGDCHNGQRPAKRK